jgi:PAS domain S-box-containing protein
VAWTRKRALSWSVLALAGFALNCLPLEVFPGVHLALGSALGIFAALRHGPMAGGVIGFLAALPTLVLWRQTFPLSPLLYAAEGVWVGYATKADKRGPLAAALSYWLLAGSWLALAVSLVLWRLPLTLAVIFQARSIINGLLAGLVVSVYVSASQAVRRRRDVARREPATFSLESLITIVLATLIALPTLYVFGGAARRARERMIDELLASSARDVGAVEGEVSGLLQNYRKGVAIAAAMIAAHQEMNQKAVIAVLGHVRKQYPEFAGMYLADAHAKTIAFDPPLSEMQQSLIGLDYSDRQYYRDLLATRSTVYSGVYQARGGMTGPAVAIGEPLLDTSGAFTGFVLGWFDLRSFQTIVSRYRREGQTMIITDAEGRLVADSSLEPGGYEDVRSLVDTTEFALIRDKQSGAFEYTEPDSEKAPSTLAAPNGFHITMTSTPITQWRVWSRQSLRPVKTKLDNLHLEQIVTLTLSLLLALAIGKIVALLLTKRINELKRSAERLAAGELSDRPAARRSLTAEIDSLYRSFYLMAENIEASWARQQELLCEVSEAKAELEATFDAMTDAVAITDPQGRLVRANRAFYQMLGRELMSGLGEPLDSLEHPNGSGRDCDLCRARLDGHHILTVSAPEKNPAGKHLGIRVDPILGRNRERLGSVQVIRDLTPLRRAEVEAEKATALLRNLVDAAYDAVYATDLDGRLLWANRKAAQLFGLVNEPLEGVLFLSTIHPSDIERVKANFEGALRGEARKYEARHFTSDDVRYALITNSPVYVDGELIAVLGIARDVTEDRLAAEASTRADKLRALGQLASGVAHNFNNSLTAVIGYTQMALNKVQDLVVTRHLRTVETAALDAAKMVQRIQNFARQRQDEAMAPADLNQIVRDALDLTRSRWRDDARASGIEYDVIFRPSDSVILTCDQSAMREVFVNLIINALDAMSEGGRLTVTTSVEREVAVIAFTDTGSGMTEEVRQRVFEPFFTTKGTKGYGMGLAVTYGIVDRHGGEIMVASRPGAGSTFTIRLPIERNVAEVSDDDSASLAPFRAKTASVLVVDDEQPIRALLADLLRARGHKVLMAEDGIAGLRAVEGARFDMVITDISMPGLDGWAVVSEVRRRWPDTKLVIVTGYGGLVDQVFLGGDADLVDALISKPFNLAEIDSTINSLLLEAQGPRLR